MATDAAGQSDRLSSECLKRLPDDVRVPVYDRSRVGIGIVHLGIGAFHRAHQAWYTDNALQREGGDWGIVGASLRSDRVSQQMNPQDGLYTVVQHSDQVPQYQVVGAVKEVLVGAQQSGQLLALMAAESTRIITLTITEKGYCYDSNNGQLAIDNPDIMGDIAGFGCQPATAVGFLVNALARRRDSHGKGVSLLSCDNLPDNGHILRQVVLDFAGRVDALLAGWIAEQVSFPSCMVDRIVPASTESDLQTLAVHLGCADQAAVFTEPFSQWVIEEDFCRGRPAWDKVGALLVEDVTPYEEAKLRLLNGSHSLIAYLGNLAGYEYVHQVVNDPDFRQLVLDYMLEVEPGLNVPASFDLQQYQQQLLQRFANPALHHRTAQIAEDGSQKIRQRWLASASGGLCPQLQIHALAFAGWCTFLRAQCADGSGFELIDPLAGELCSITRDGTEPVAELLSMLGYEGLAGEDSEFVANTRRFCLEIGEHGVKATIANFLARKTS